MKNLNFKSILLAGFIGTMMFDVFGLIMMGQWWDIPALLSGKMSAPLTVGVIAHYMNGFFLALLFSVSKDFLLGPNWLKPLLFISIQTVVIVWLFMFPMLDLGIGGIKGGMMMPIASLMRHWVFAVPMIFLFKEKTATV